MALQENPKVAYWEGLTMTEGGPHAERGAPT
jgi:hypothetical protein